MCSGTFAKKLLVVAVLLSVSVDDIFVVHFFRKFTNQYPLLLNLITFFLYMHLGLLDGATADKQKVLFLNR
jgi:hypothetical protein